jgi:hypothetical protein
MGWLYIQDGRGTLKVGDACYSEAAVNMYQITQRHFPEVCSSHLGAGLEAHTLPNTAFISVFIYTQSRIGGGLRGRICG